jgi:alginate O-acetyltransferase complex protein AlgI
MVFSSPIFLFLFLPLVLAIYFIFPGNRLRNYWLLAVSIVFYAWGEVLFVFLILASSVMNYLLGLYLEGRTDARVRKWTVTIAVALNLGLLVFFKYANFFTANVNSLRHAFNLTAFKWESVPLPIGISFFTFHALSYIIDIYRRKCAAARNPADMALYIFFFPQLIAGPILRWSVIAPQIARRMVTRDRFAGGIRRFIYGLTKKILVANTLAVSVDKIFLLSHNVLTPSLAWLAVTGYMLQIYFDFSGYSDMAIGLGKMFGFEFMENFNYPYISQSIREFWRRWHISLSSWFRDYLYFPLGGNRSSPGRTGLNLIIVFFLCGLWHGASWTFVVWGLYHGCFLILERTRFGPFLDSRAALFRHIYTLLVVLLGWVFFRAESLGQALTFFSALFGVSHGSAPDVLFEIIFTQQFALALLAGMVFATPVAPWLERELGRLFSNAMERVMQWTIFIAEPLLLMALLVICATRLAGGTYNPFIYFRF